MSFLESGNNPRTLVLLQNVEIYNYSRTHIKVITYDVSPTGEYYLEKKSTLFRINSLIGPDNYSVNGVDQLGPYGLNTVSLIQIGSTGPSLTFEYSVVRQPAFSTIEELVTIVNGYLAYTGVALSKNGGTPLDPLGVVNLIEGANITLSLANDIPNDRTDVTISAAGGGGGFSYVPVAVSTTPYAVVPITGWYMYLVDATAGAITMNFPTAVGNNAVYTVKKVDSSANTVILTPNGAETIDGAATQTIRFQNTSVDLYSDNANLYIM
jgi:hypothetical protein